MLRSRRLRSGTGNEIAVEHHQIGEHPGRQHPAVLSRSSQPGTTPVACSASPTSSTGASNQLAGEAPASSSER